jgi:hypothetical protein
VSETIPLRFAMSRQWAVNYNSRCPKQQIEAVEVIREIL